MKTANRLNGSAPNGRGTQAPPTLAPPPPASGAPLFSAAAIAMQHRMRINPLPRLNPQTLGTMLDQFEYGYLREAVLLWEAMCKRDDTLVTVKPQLESEVASQDWGVYTVHGADPNEAARHKACLDYFYDHVRVTDAYDRNVRGGRDKLLKFLMYADSFTYELLHIVWCPQPGKTVPVQAPASSSSAKSKIENQRPSGSDSKMLASVPVISAELEHVPLWFFENTTGTLRLLKDGGFGTDGTPLSEFGDWIVATGRGLMHAASICYTFKRLSFQDWVIFNERYAQNKVVGVTPGGAESAQGQAMANVVGAFNEDQGIVFYEFTGDPDKPPISLLGPEGIAAVETWKLFIERQDAKMSSMYRGNDLSMMSRAGDRGERRVGASLQEDEGDDMIRGACRELAGTLQECLDRRVIELCFGVGVEPLAYIGLADQDKEDVAQLIESAGFLADRDFQVSASDIAERVGIQEAHDASDVLGAAPSPALDPNLGDGKSQAPNPKSQRSSKSQTSNTADRDLETFLGPLAERFRKAYADDLIPVRLALEHVLRATPGNVTANARALQAQLPWLADQILGNGPHKAPRSAGALAAIMEKAMERAMQEAESQRQ